MDFTDINNYDMKEEDENEEEIDVVSKRYNPYTIIFQIVTQLLNLNKENLFVNKAKSFDHKLIYSKPNIEVNDQDQESYMGAIQKAIGEEGALVTSWDEARIIVAFMFVVNNILQISDKNKRNQVNF